MVSSRVVKRNPQFTSPISMAVWKEFYNYNSGDSFEKLQTNSRKFYPFQVLYSINQFLHFESVHLPETAYKLGRSIRCCQPPSNPSRGSSLAITNGILPCLFQVLYSINQFLHFESVHLPETVYKLGPSIQCRKPPSNPSRGLSLAITNGVLPCLFLVLYTNLDGVFDVVSHHQICQGGQA